jgi:hypothetical protein
MLTAARRREGDRNSVMHPSIPPLRSRTLVSARWVREHHGTLPEHCKGASMKLSQVRCFLAVCETRNFTRAAQVCGVSQPSLSMAIRRLERKLGAALFERRAPIELTSLGKRARPLLLRLHEMASRVEELCAVQTSARRVRNGLNANLPCNARPQPISPPRR